VPPTLTRPHTSRPAAEAGQASAGKRKRAPGIASIRERLVVTILLLTFFGIGMSGAVAYVLQWTRIQSQAYAQLSRDASDFRDLAYLNIDPGTGKPFTDVSDLLRGALQSKTLSESGGILGISDGKVVWKANSSVTVRPENDPAFVALVLEKSKLSNVTTERYTSGSTDYAYLVVPVSWIYTGETGALVRVIDLSIERKALNETLRHVLARRGRSDRGHRRHHVARDGAVAATDQLVAAHRRGDHGARPQATHPRTWQRRPRGVDHDRERDARVGWSRPSRHRRAFSTTSDTSSAPR